MVLVDKMQHRIWLEGIDAPQKGQADGTKALADEVFAQTVRVDWKMRNCYGRILGRMSG